MKRLCLGISALASAALVAAPAAAACWDEATYQAAQVRELDLMLRDAAARCQASAGAFAADYALLVRAGGHAFASAGETLQRHFASEYGAAQSTAAGAAFAAALAGDAASASRGLSCDDMAVLAHQAAASGATPEGLARFASAADLRPRSAPQLCRSDNAPLLIARVDASQ